MVAKATYDPELEKQLAEERKKAREARTKFRQTLDDLRKKDGDLIVNNRLTPLGSTQSAALFKTMNDWLAATPDATTEEILDKQQEMIDKLSNIYSEDANRLYFYNILKVNDYFLTMFKTNNVISDDIYKKCKEILDREQKWLEKNPNESLQVYKDKIDKTSKELQDILKDPEVQKRLDAARNGVKLEDNSKDIEAKKQEAERLAKAKEEKEKAQFNPMRLFKKVGGGIFTAFWIAILLAFAVLGGSLAANEAVIRPTGYKILYFFYGFLFFPVVILYFVGRYFLYNKPPYFAAFLIPLFEYDPLQAKKDSFLQRLVWYKMNPIIEQAQKTFQASADSVKDIHVDFQAIAAKALEGK
jgi:lipopolysaccharide export LptBFGC system permease protein LptF